MPYQSSPRVDVLLAIQYITVNISIIYSYDNEHISNVILLIEIFNIHSLFLQENRLVNINCNNF